MLTEYDLIEEDVRISKMLSLFDKKIVDKTLSELSPNKPTPFTYALCLNILKRKYRHAK